jgi:hypothetical protein
LKLAGLVVALIVATHRPADACSCAEPVPACEAYATTPIIFIGKVTEVRTVETEIEATFTVTEKLKGNPGDTESVEGGGLCGTMFQKGKTYIVYAGGSPGRLTSSLCSRTATTDRAKDDVTYARTFEKRTLGVLEGVVSVTEPQGAHTKRAGVEVRVRDTKFKARTDKTGRYKLELPPGKYTLDIVDPKARVPADTSETVNLAAPSSCAHRDIALVWNGRVRGKVVSPDGKQPAANVQLTLVAAGATRAGNQFTTSDAKGTYEFSGVQAGEYNLVVYSTKGVPTTTYFPGVDDVQQAKTIKVVQSGLVQKIDIKLLP